MLNWTPSVGANGKTLQMENNIEDTVHGLSVMLVKLIDKINMSFIKVHQNIILKNRNIRTC